MRELEKDVAAGLSPARKKKKKKGPERDPKGC